MEKEIYEGGFGNVQTHHDCQRPEAPEDSEDRRLRRMPDLLPVSLQDQLHGWQPSLQALIIPIPERPACGAGLFLCPFFAKRTKNGIASVEGLDAVPLTA
jgi:hypothetical protein